MRDNRVKDNVLNSNRDGLFIEVRYLEIDNDFRCYEVRVSIPELACQNVPIGFACLDIPKDKNDPEECKRIEEEAIAMAIQHAKQNLPKLKKFTFKK